jgi:hypothetical protein
MSIYCSGEDIEVYSYEGSHVSPWKSKKEIRICDVSTIPPWIANDKDFQDIDSSGNPIVCPYVRFGIYNPDIPGDLYEAVLDEAAAIKIVGQLLDFIQYTKAEIPIEIEEK